MDMDKTIGALGEIAAYFRSPFDAIDGTAACKKFRSWTDAIEHSVALMKAQEPVKPVLDIDTWECGNCGHTLEHQQLLGDNVLFHEQYNYCPECGRKVWWE